MTRKTETLIRLSLKAKEDLKIIAANHGLSQSEMVEKLITEHVQNTTNSANR